MKAAAKNTNAVKQPLARVDPILQELWEIKAGINSEAKYQTKNIIARAQKYDHQAALALWGLSVK